MDRVFISLISLDRVKLQNYIKPVIEFDVVNKLARKMHVSLNFILFVCSASLCLYLYRVFASFNFLEFMTKPFI